MPPVPIKTPPAETVVLCFFQYEKLSEGSKLFSFTNLEMSINKL